jgi:hypothetical protein
MINNLHLQGVRTFGEYFALDSATRHSLYNEAHSIPTNLRLIESPRYYSNYEVHHAPLAYTLMAVPEALLARVSLPTRILIMRLIVSIVSVMLTACGAFALAQECRLSEPFATTLVFLIFSCQMFWAAVAHIANDGLAIPLALWLAVSAIRFDRQPSTRTAVWLAIIISLGLLTKAYFLVFVPLYLLAVIRRRRSVGLLLTIPLVLAGPWYVRNLIVYGNLSGRVEESNGVTIANALTSLTSIPWLKSLPFMARGAFWMGNSSFTDFSILTMNTLLLLLLLALALYLWTTVRHRQHYGQRATEAFLWAPVLLFAAAMIYVTGSSYSYTKGVATAASPWYLQAVIPLLLCLAMLGCQRGGRPGRLLATAMTVLWGYILGATYIAKLFPLYGGFQAGRSTLHDIARWYLADWTRTADILSTTSLAPAPLLFAELLMLLATLLLLAPALCWSHHRQP